MLIEGHVTRQAVIASISRLGDGMIFMGFDARLEQTINASDAIQRVSMPAILSEMSAGGCAIVGNCPTARSIVAARYAQPDRRVRREMPTDASSAKISNAYRLKHLARFHFSECHAMVKR